MRIVFMGTSRFAKEALRALNENQYEITLVVTEPNGSGKSPVGEYASSKGLSLVETEILGEEIRDAIHGAKPDVILVSGFGLILPEEYLSLATIGCLGLHASLLPRWRGPCPVHHTVRSGDPKTGVTIFSLTEKPDAGDIIAQAPCFTQDKTEGELYDELSALGGAMIVYTLDAIYSVIRLIPQEEAFVTYAPRESEKDPLWE